MPPGRARDHRVTTSDDANSSSKKAKKSSGGGSNETNVVRASATGDGDGADASMGTGREVAMDVACASERAALEATLDPATQRREHGRARKTLNASIGVATRTADEFARRALESAREATTSGRTSTEVLTATTVSARVFAAAPRLEFEARCIEKMRTEDVLELAIARGFDLVTQEAREGMRTTPADADVLAESAALAYTLTKRVDNINALTAMLSALFRYLTLERAPSRDAAVTAGVTLALARANDGDVLQAFEDIFFDHDSSIAAISGATVMKTKNVECSNEILSSFGALALLRGFAVIVEPEALTNHRRGAFIFDNVLPRLCSLIESAGDVHYRYHAVSCLRAVLEKVKDAMMGGSSVVPHDAFERVASTISSLWEDSLTQTVREGQTCFRLLLDIAPSVRGDAETHDIDYVDRIVERTMQRPVEQKSKYLALQVLVEKVGARRILAAEPNVLANTLGAMRQTAISSAASTALDDLSAVYLKELASVDKWRQWWLPIVKESILVDDRATVVTYVLPIFIKRDIESIFDLTKCLVDEANEKKNDIRLCSAVVSVLKVARSLQLVDPDHIVVIRAGKNDREYAVEQNVIERAMVCADKSTRLDVLEWLCLEGRKGQATVALPGEYELELLQRMIASNLKGETVAFRNALVTSVSKVFARIWVGVNHVGQKLRRRGEAALKNGAQKVGEVDALKAHVQKAQRAHVFMSDIVRVLFSNLYPGAPYERRCTALELLNSVVESWKSYGDISGRNNDLIIAKQLLSSPYSVFMQDEAYTSLLMGALVDSWEKMRMTAFKLLRRHASPLAGIETPEKLAKQLEWALELLHSPRVRESGAAALMIRLLIHKYIFELNWNIELSPHVRVAQGHQGENRDSTNLQVLKMLCDLLEQDIYAAEQDIIEGCRRCLAHGAILLAKYTLCDLNFKGDTREHTQDAMNRMMTLMERATHMALDFISQPDALGATAEEVILQSDDQSNINDDMEELLDLAPKAQIITTACWLTVKEISLLTGEVMSAPDTADLFSFDVVKAVGERLISVLFTVKHTGVLARTRIGLTALCACLMRNSSNALKALPETWLNGLFDQLNRPEQGIRDRVRRSAGLPYAFMAILLAEPKGQPRVALESALPKLLDIACGETSTSDIPRVHAFNVVRVIFADKDLSVDTTTHASRGVQVCIDAFSSQTWEIKNAATLAYSSLLTKVCGYINTVTRQRMFTSDGRHEVKLADFARRYPTLMGHLLRELEVATATLHLPTAVDVHPSLYPILALFSRLRPSLERDLHSSGDKFIATIRRCVSGKYLAVRTMAARALVPLLSSTRLCEYIEDILELRSLVAPGLNAVHGALLCVLEIINEVRSSTYAEDVCWSDFVDGVSRRLISFAGIAVTSRSPLISATWLRCAEATLSVANSCQKCSRTGCACAGSASFEQIGGLTRMIWQCSAPVLSSRAAGHPGSSEWNKAAAGVRVRLAVGYDSWSVPLNAHIRALLDTGDVDVALHDTLSQDLAYEYRAEAYKVMFKMPHDDSISHMTMRKLRQAAAANLSSETRHSCARRTLQCIDLWSSLCDVGDADDERAVWRAVREVAFEDVNERVRSEGLRCLARLCKRRLAVDADEIINTSGELDQFVRTIFVGSTPSMSDETRCSAVDALARSELLCHLTSSTVRDDRAGELALLTWKCALALIQDEDADIRTKAARAVSCALPPSAPHAHTAVIISHVFSHMHAEFGRFDAFRKYIIEIAAGEAYDEPRFATLIANATTVRRLFDKEADNPYAEPLEMAYSAASQIENDFDAQTASHALERVLGTLDCMKSALRSSPSASDAWVGGITNHETCFVPIANALIGARALGARAMQKPDDENSLMERIAQTTRELYELAPAVRAIFPDDRKVPQSGHRTTS